MRYPGGRTLINSGGEVNYTHLFSNNLSHRWSGRLDRSAKTGAAARAGNSGIIAPSHEDDL